MPAGPAPTIARRSFMRGVPSCAPRGAGAGVRGKLTTSRGAFDDRLGEAGERLLDRSVGERGESGDRLIRPAVRLHEGGGGDRVRTQFGDRDRELLWIGALGGTPLEA